MVKTSAMTMKANPVPWAESSSSLTREQFFRRLSGWSLNVICYTFSQYHKKLSSLCEARHCQEILCLENVLHVSTLELSPVFLREDRDITEGTSIENFIVNILNSLLHAFLEKVNSFEAKDGEYDGTGVDGSKCVADGEDDDVFDTVFLRIVVRAKADDGAKSQAEGVEHLIGRIQPNCRLEQHLHLGSEHMGQTSRGPPEGDASEEEDCQHEVGEHG